MDLRKEELKRDGWKWMITATYNDTVKWPKVPGNVAIETVHSDDVSKAMELEAFSKRTDVNIVITEL